MEYDTLYKNNSAVWGEEPSGLLLMIFEKLKRGSSFLDLGCGQGRDCLFMLENGFEVVAVDSSASGLSSIKNKISEKGLPIEKIELVEGDMRDFEIEKDKFSVINAFNSLQFLPKKNALKLLEKIKTNLKVGGYFLIASFTTKDSFFEKSNPEKQCFFEENELKNIFHDFEIAAYEEKVVADAGHPGSPQPHEHGIVRMIARKPLPNDSD